MDKDRGQIRNSESLNQGLCCTQVQAVLDPSMSEKRKLNTFVHDLASVSGPNWGLLVPFDWLQARSSRSGLQPACSAIRSQPLTMRPIALFAALVAASSGSICLDLPAHAQSSDEDKIEARIGAWGRNCKNAVAAKFNAKSMSEVEISLGASLRASIDAGEITLADIKSGGLSFNYRVHHVAGKDPEGYCNTDGQGNVEVIKNMHD